MTHFISTVGRSNKHILTSHEQGAAHAADGYARATGKVGVCMATSGPGATNLVTGIATAYMDSVPMVAITANVTLPLLGKDSFQEVDIAGVTMPITKHGYIVKNVEILADTIRKAFHIARSGRPGPVLIDITKDVTAATCEYTPVTIQPEERVTRYTREELMLVAEMIHKAKKPYIYLGGGAIISGASAEVAEFAELIDAPVCDTLMGKGAFDGRSERYTGMIGMHGTKTSNLGVSECDLLVALGERKNHPTGCGCCGDQQEYPCGCISGRRSEEDSDRIECLPVETGTSRVDGTYNGTEGKISSEIR